MKRNIGSHELPRVTIQDCCFDLPYARLSQEREDGLGGGLVPHQLSDGRAAWPCICFPDPNPPLLLRGCPFPFGLCPSCLPGLLLPEVFPASSCSRRISPPHPLNRCSLFAFPGWSTATPQGGCSSALVAAGGCDCGRGGGGKRANLAAGRS